MLANKIREQLASYLAKGIELDSFEDWLVQNTWNIAKSGDPESRHLAFAIELRLAEHSSDHLQLENLQRELSAILASQSAKISKESIGFESGASNQIVKRPVLVPYQWQPSGKSGGVVFVS